MKLTSWETLNPKTHTLYNALLSVAYTIPPDERPATRVISTLKMHEVTGIPLSEEGQESLRASMESIARGALVHRTDERSAYVPLVVKFHSRPTETDSEEITPEIWEISFNPEALAIIQRAETTPKVMLE